MPDRSQPVNGLVSKPSDTNELQLTVPAPGYGGCHLCRSRLPHYTHDQPVLYSIS